MLPFLLHSLSHGIPDHCSTPRVGPFLILFILGTSALLLLLSAGSWVSLERERTRVSPSKSIDLIESFLSQFPEQSYHLSTAVKILPLSLIFVGMISFNNLCLQYLSPLPSLFSRNVQVSFYLVARSLTILFNVIFTYFFPFSLYWLLASSSCIQPPPSLSLWLCALSSLVSLLAPRVRLISLLPVLCLVSAAPFLSLWTASTPRSWCILSITTPGFFASTYDFFPSLHSIEQHELLLLVCPSDYLLWEGHYSSIRSCSEFSYFLGLDDLGWRSWLLDWYCYHSTGILLFLLVGSIPRFSWPLPWLTILWVPSRLASRPSWLSSRVRPWPYRVWLVTSPSSSAPSCTPSLETVRWMLLRSVLRLMILIWRRMMFLRIVLFWRMLIKFNLFS